MTPEEAIRVFERMLDEFYNEDSYAPECKDAVDMAIEALMEQSKHNQNTMSKQPDLDTLGIKTEETCADAISRQDAIDAVEFGITYVKVLNKETGEVMELVKKSNEEVQKAVDRIEALPSAQPEPTLEKIEEYCHKRCLSIVDNALLHKYALAEQQWIPCSERLPENDERVLATTAWGEVTIAERIYPPIDDTCWFIHDGYMNATIDDVVAWMPLPEPYKGES